MSNKLLIFLAVAFLAFADLSSAKVFERCELARLLRDKYGFKSVATWMCIAYHESNYNTAAYNPSSGDHGLFQISELYWCYPPGTGCGVTCAALEDDDITDDVACVRVVYDAMGFPAWTTYTAYCQHEDVNTYIAGCF